MIFYLHQHPEQNSKETINSQSFSPHPIDAGNCGYYADRLFNSHNSANRFYIATFGYAKNWKENNTIDRQIDRYTLHFVFGGKGEFNGQLVSSGQMFIAPQNEKYTVITDEKDPLQFAWIALSGTDLEYHVNLLHLPSKAMISYFENTKTIQNIFLSTIYGEPAKLNKELYLCAKFYEILSFCNVTTSSFSNPTNHPANIYYSKIISYINSHYADPISSSDIAKHVHISTTYLRQICREKANTPPQKLIANKRISVAKILLATDNISIEKISSLVGFANVGAFSKCFKKMCGISPLQFRKQKREELIIRAQKAEQNEP